MQGLPACNMKTPHPPLFQGKKNLSFIDKQKTFIYASLFNVGRSGREVRGWVLSVPLTSDLLKKGVIISQMILINIMGAGCGHRLQTVQIKNLDLLTSEKAREVEDWLLNFIKNLMQVL